MSNPSIHPDLDRLLAKLLEEGLQPTEQEQLGRILSDDAASRHFYRKYLIVDALLRWENAPPIATSQLAPEESQIQTAPRGLGTSVSSGAAIPFPIPYPLSPVPSFFGGMLFSYLAAAVILGVALMVASVWKMAAPTQQIVHEPSMPAARQQRESGLSMEFVGRITGLVDCQWADSNTAVPGPVAVPLGRKYALASGLMEITYDTGAKVILQGPCTYEVDSIAGGFLSVGKLTARVEKKEERRTMNEELSGSRSSFLIPHSYFAITTPTATVTDLGTEFGVEVDARNGCYVETFVGLVSVSPTSDGKPAESRSVAAGQSICVDAGGVVAKPRTTETHFVRNMQQREIAPYTKAVLKDRPWVYWPLDERPGARWVSNRMGNGADGRVVGIVRLGQDGPLSGGRNFAAEFTGHGYIETSQLPKNDLSRGFSAEFWARVDGGTGLGLYRSPITFRDCQDTRDQAGFTFYAMPDETWTFVSGTGQSWVNLVGPPVVQGQWVYIAATFEPTGKDPTGLSRGVRKLYVDASLVATDEHTFLPNLKMPVRIGAGSTESPSPEFLFFGRIAHVALYDRPLGEECIKTHWNASKLATAADEPARKEATSK